MISVDRSSNRGMLFGIVVAAAVGAGAVWWWVGEGESPQAEPALAASAPEAAAPAPTMAVPTASADHTFAAPPPAASGPEVDDGLKRVMSGQVDGEKELKRVTEFLQFQRMFERYQDISQDPTKSDLKLTMARQLFAMLPERVQKAELSQPEGLLLCSVLLQELEPNEDKRNDRLAQCSENLTSVAPQAANEQQARAIECQLEYRRRESALVAEYQAAAPVERNPAQLEKALDEAKRSVYDAPDCGRG